MKKAVEEILTKDEAKDTQNIQRVDKRPASIYSIIVFAMVFLIGYLFYPHISMLLPLPGQKLTVATDYQAQAVTEMLDAENIVIAVAGDVGKTASVLSTTGEPIVYKLVSFTLVDSLKGEMGESFNVPQYGGSALFTNRNTSRKQKYTVSYENAAAFEKGETYLLFIDAYGEVINGRAGALKQGSDGVFTDINGTKYTKSDISDLLSGGIV